MSDSVRFYRALGFELKFGGVDATFTSFHVGDQFLNIIAADPAQALSWWGRAIFYVDDVDAFYANVISAGFQVHEPPSDAIWGERYFHMNDPDGHELSFAMPLERDQ